MAGWQKHIVEDEVKEHTVVTPPHHWFFYNGKPGGGSELVKMWNKWGGKKTVRTVKEGWEWWIWLNEDRG